MLSWHIEVMAERSGLQSLAPNSPRKRRATSQVFGFRADWRRTYFICAISKDSIKDNKHFPGMVCVFMEIAHLSLPWSNGWVTLSFLVRRLFVRLSRYGNTQPNLHFFSSIYTLYRHENKSLWLTPQKNHFLILTMFWPWPEKVIQRKKLPFPK